MELQRLIEATCPECRGPLTELDNDGIVEYRCLVGHRYSPLGILQSHYETQERALWAAVVSLEEATNIVHAVKRHVSLEQARDLTRQAEEKRQQAQALRTLLDQLRAFRTGD